MMESKCSECAKYVIGVIGVIGVMSVIGVMGVIGVIGYIFAILDSMCECDILSKKMILDVGHQVYSEYA